VKAFLQHQVGTGARHGPDHKGVREMSDDNVKQDGKIALK